MLATILVFNLLTLYELWRLRRATRRLNGVSWPPATAQGSGREKQTIAVSLSDAAPVHDTIRLFRQALVNSGWSLMDAQLKAQELVNTKILTPPFLPSVPPATQSGPAEPDCGCVHEWLMTLGAPEAEMMTTASHPQWKPGDRTSCGLCGALLVLGWIPAPAAAPTTSTSQKPLLAGSPASSTAETTPTPGLTT